jgi:hypothetical protein
VKILLAGSFEKSPVSVSTVYFMHKSLKDLGQEIIPFDYRVKRRELGNKESQEEMIALVERERPDIFLLVRGEEIFPESLKKIRTISYVALQYMDSPIKGWVVRLARASDSFFITAGGLVERYKRLGIKNVFHLWQGCDPEVNRYIPSDSPEYQCDVAFTGVNKAGREGLLRKVMKAGFDLKVWGRDWPNNFPVQKERTEPEEFAKVCSGAKIVLGLNDNNTIPDYFSNRTFLTLACRGFHITSYVPRLERWFTNKKHLVWYNTKKKYPWSSRYGECIDLIKYYLDKPEERKRIARAGQEWVYSHYTWRHSMKKMIGILGELIEKGR